MAGASEGSVVFVHGDRQNGVYFHVVGGKYHGLDGGGNGQSVPQIKADLLTLRGEGYRFSIGAGKDHKPVLPSPRPCHTLQLSELGLKHHLP